MEGKRVPQSDFLAFRYLRELTNNSDPVVHRMMGEILTRDKGVPPNPGPGPQALPGFLAPLPGSSEVESNVHNPDEAGFHL